MEEEKILPKATIVSIIKECLGDKKIKFGKKPTDHMIEFAHEFVHHISRCSNDICQSDGKKNITPQHVFKALDSQHFQEYKPELERYLDEYNNEANITKQKQKEKKESQLNKSQLLEHQQALFRNAKQNMEEQQMKMKLAQSQRESMIKAAAAAVAVANSNGNADLNPNITATSTSGATATSSMSATASSIQSDLQRQMQVTESSSSSITSTINQQQQHPSTSGGQTLSNASIGLIPIDQGQRLAGTSLPGIREFGAGGHNATGPDGFPVPIGGVGAHSLGAGGNKPIGSAGQTTNTATVAGSGESGNMGVAEDGAHKINVDDLDFEDED